MPFVSDLSKEEIELVLKQYGLHKLGGFKEFYLGLENSNIQVKTRKGFFVLRQWRSAKPQNIIFELSVMNELHKKSFLVPKIVKTVKGKQLLLLNGKRFALFEFMLGKHIKSRNLNATQLQEMGKTLAGTQLALKDFKPKGKSEFKDLFDFEFEHQIIKKVFPKLSKDYEAIVQGIKKEISALEPKLKKTKQIRTGPVHHDFFYWNIKFKGNKISAILDFGASCNGAWISDLATTLAATALINPTTKSLQTKTLKQIIKGYQNKIVLNKTETKTLPSLIIRGLLRSIICEIKALTEQQKNKKLYEKWIKEDWATIQQTKQQLPKIKKTLNKIMPDCRYVIVNED